MYYKQTINFCSGVFDNFCIFTMHSIWNYKSTLDK